MGKKTFSRHTDPFAERLLRKVRFYGLPLTLIFGLFLAVNWLSSHNETARLVHDKALTMMEPVLSVTKGPIDALSEKVSIIKGLNEDASAYAALKRENEDLKQWIHVAKMMKAENKALKNLMNIKHDDDLSFVSAKVIMDTQSSYAHTILVQIGDDNTVAKGQAAVSEKGLVGRVIEVGDNYARILLLNDVNARIPAVVVNSDDKAILSGQNKAMPTLEHLSEYHMVKAGQKVITSGHGGALPYGLDIGETVQNEDGSFSVKLYAQEAQSGYVKIIDYGLTPSLTGGALASAEFDGFAIQ